MYVSRSRHSCGGRRVVFAKVHRTINVHVKSSLTSIENALRFGIESYSGLHTCRLVSGCFVRGRRDVLSFKIVVMKLMFNSWPSLSQTLCDSTVTVFSVPMLLFHPFSFLPYSPMKIAVTSVSS